MIILGDATEIRIPAPYGHIAGSFHFIKKNCKLNFEIWFLGKAWGDPNGKPILGLHGWLDNAGTHDHIAPLLNEVRKGSLLKKTMIFHDILQKGG